MAKTICKTIKFPTDLKKRVDKKAKKAKKTFHKTVLETLEKNI